MIMIGVTRGPAMDPLTIYRAAAAALKKKGLTLVEPFGPMACSAVIL